MKRMELRYIVLSIKQNLVSPSFYLLCILLALGMLLSKAIMNKYSEGVPVLYVNEGDEKSSEIVESLKDNSPEGFEFIEEEDEENLVDKVMRGEAACGLIISDEILPIEFYKYAGSPDAYVVKEYVFSVLQSECSNDSLLKYLNETDANIEIEVKDEILKLNRQYIDGIKLDIFKVIELEDNREKLQTKDSGKVVDILVLIIAFLLISADTLSSDREFYSYFNKGKAICLKTEKCLVNFLMLILVYYFVSIICL